MTMTLTQVAWKLGELAREGAVRYDAHDMAVMCSQMADAVTSHLSQPQPVAQGEAVDLDIEWPEFHQQGMGCGLEDRGITDRYDAMRYGWDEALAACANAFKNATPTIPAGHRVVPTEAIDHEAIAEVVEEMLSEHPTAASVHEQTEDWADRLTRALQGVKDV
jgi:hypothetical protein